MKRITDFKDEQAIDLLADILEPAARIMSDGKVQQMFMSGTPSLLVVKYLLKEHKKSVIEILALLDGKSVDDYHFNLITLTKDLLYLLNDQELMQVFQLQGQTEEEKCSGSAMENTEEEETK